MTDLFKQNLSKDFKLKAFALLVALSLEFFFYSPENSMRELVPSLLVFTNLPENAIMTSPLYGANGIPAEVEVEGPMPIVKQLQQRLLKIPYRVSEKSIPGSITLKLETSMVPVPPGVKVLKIYSNFKTARIDLIKEKDE